MSMMRKGEELKAPRHASAVVTRDDVTICDIVPTLALFLLWLLSLYI